MPSDALRDVRDELAIWEQSGKFVRIWMRDDDAVCVTPALLRLERLAQAVECEVGLAVIPGLATTDLADYLSSRSSPFLAMCHGWKHEQHASIESGEFGVGRPRHTLRAEAVRALKRFQDLFGRHDPIFVPPFGRLDPEFVPELLQIGFGGVSNHPTLWQGRVARLNAALKWLPNAGSASRLMPAILDTHIDPIDWLRMSARPTEKLAAQLVGELRLRRKGYIRSDAPIGILSHHLVHDDSIWTLLERVMEVLAASRAVRLQSASNLAAECSRTVRLAEPRVGHVPFGWRDAVEHD